MPVLKNAYELHEYNDEEFIKATEDDEFERYELIDGKVYAFSAPNLHHQNVFNYINDRFRAFFNGKQCRAFCAPFNVHLHADAKKTGTSSSQTFLWSLLAPPRPA